MRWCMTRKTSASCSGSGMRPNDDFQDLPSWRELGVATALSLRRHHADTLIVPMSLIRDAYRAEILRGLADAGEEGLHVFLEADRGVRRGRHDARGDVRGNSGSNHPAREWALSRIDAAVVAAARQPAGTLMLRSDRLTPAELADEVLAEADLRQAHGDGMRRQTRSLDSNETYRSLTARVMAW